MGWIMVTAFIFFWLGYGVCALMFAAKIGDEIIEYRDWDERRNKILGHNFMKEFEEKDKRNVSTTIKADDLIRLRKELKANYQKKIKVEMRMPENLIEGIQRELKRNRELLVEYESIPQGVFGATMIKHTIIQAEKAIAVNDVTEMIKVLAELQETK